MGNRKRRSLEEPISQVNWLDGITVTPNGNHNTTRQEWRKANAREQEQDEINRFTGNIRKSMNNAGEKIADAIMTIPFPATEVDSFIAKQIGKGIGKLAKTKLGQKIIHNIEGNHINSLKQARKASDEKWDRLYFKAIENNDYKEAQRLRDLHFLAKSENPKLNVLGNPENLYHTVNERFDPNFTVFNTEIEGQPTNIYLTNNKIMSGTYAPNTVLDKQDILNNEGFFDYIDKAKSLYKGDYDYYSRMLTSELNKSNLDKNKIETLKELISGYKSELNDLGVQANEKYHSLLKQIDPIRRKEFYADLRKSFTIPSQRNSNLGNVPSNWNDLSISHMPDEIRKSIERDERFFTLTGPKYSTRSVDRAMRNTDYDSAVIEDIYDYGSNKIRNKTSGDVVELKNNTQLKSSKAIEKDDNGIIIPLSKRDNFKNSDYRYIVPILFGSGTYLNSNKKFGGRKSLEII